MIAGTLIIGGVEYVVVPRSEYEAWMPRLPAKDQRGERPAKEAIQAVIARSLIRRRTEAGLGQKQLAALAAVRPETISRIESGRYRPQRATMERPVCCPGISLPATEGHWAAGAKRRRTGLVDP